MKNLRSYYLHLRQPQTVERKWIFPLAIGSIVSLFLLFLATLTSPDGTPPLIPLRRYASTASTASVFVESKLRPLPISSLPPPPRLAYLVSGSAGDGKMLRRTLQALYHPNNRYVVHLDAESSPEERLDLQNFVKNHPIFTRFGNVLMITKANLVTYRGPTMVANTLHAAAILLRDGGDWDWFINLSAADYPLVTQDDLLHTFSYLPRDLNFIDHTSNIGWNLWKEFQRPKTVIIDPGLYMTKKSDIFWITQRRSVPTAFKLFTDPRGSTKCFMPMLVGAFNFNYASNMDMIVFLGNRNIFQLCDLYEHTLSLPHFPMVRRAFHLRDLQGSAWMALSRPFIDFCIWGWDNLPRTVLMYYANFISSPEYYFHTVMCNAPEFSNTTVNSDLHFISWDNPPKQHPLYLTVDDMARMVESNVPFARKFHQDDPVLDKIDSELLFRSQDMLVPGGWCMGSKKNGTDPCSVVGNITVLRPTSGAKRLENLISSLLSSDNFRPRQCK